MVIKMTNITKNQHYVPVCVLKHFSDEKGKMFEIFLPQKKIYKRDILESMSESYIYEHPSLTKNIIENTFASIESSFSLGIEEVIKNIENTKNGSSNIKEVRKKLELFIEQILVFYYRSRALLEEFDFESNKKEDKIFEMLNKIFDIKYIRDLGNVLKKHYNFCIIENLSDSFLISDQYISTVALKIKNRFSNISNRNIGLKDTMVLIPLTNKYYAVYYEGEKPEFINKFRIITLNNEQIIKINSLIINNSYIKCAAKDKSQIEDVMTNYKYKSPLMYNIGGKYGFVIKKEVFFKDEDEENFNFFFDLEWTKFDKLKNNDLCLCNSDKLFENCCLKKYNLSKKLYENIEKGVSHKNYIIKDNNIVEKSIKEF
jgi:hypothetical protein